MKVNRYGYSDLYRSETLQSIRAEMLCGVRPKTCSRCFSQEDAGVRSSREIYNEIWQEDREYHMSDVIDPRYVDLRLGNLCNLKCRMCNPYSSNQWIDEWETIHGSFPEGERDWLKNMNWAEHEGSDRHLKEMMHHVEEIYFTGGEPTIIQRHDQLLDYCIDTGLAKNIRLKYNTNLTNVPVRLIEKWRHFAHLRLNCSIDGIGPLNDYIRYPSKWKGVWRNYTRVLERAENGVLDIHTTVQVTNILDLHRLLEHFVTAQTSPVIFFNILDHPDCLNIQILPQQLKQLAQQRLEPWLDLPGLSGVLDYMWHVDRSAEWPAFVQHTRQLDQMRGQRLEQIVPEFTEWLT
jgi:sulfatase maturation enzyme AslB (radical SAM superfamily)